MNTFEVDQVDLPIGLNISNEDDAYEFLFRRQNYKKTIEELKNILNEFVQYANKENEYNDFKVKDKTIEYKKNEYKNGVSTTKNLTIKNWNEYLEFFNDDISNRIDFFKTKVKVYPEDIPSEEEKKNGWLLIILAILCVLGIGYYMMKEKKGKGGKK